MVFEKLSRTHINRITHLNVNSYIGVLAILAESVMSFYHKGIFVTFGFRLSALAFSAS